MPAYRWATLGCGVIGHELAQAMQALGGNLYSVGNRTHEKALAFAEKYGISKVYDRPEDIFADPDVDIVYISTPHNTHIRYLLPALPAALLGCAVFITAPADESSGTKPVIRRALPILTFAGSIFFLITAVTEVRARIGEEREVNTLFAPTLRWAQTLTEDDIVITTNRHINEEMAFLSPARCYVIGEEESALMQEIFGNVESQEGSATTAITPLLTRTENIYFLDYEVAPYPGVEEVLSDDAITYERVSEIFIEGPVTVYQLQ